MTTLVPASSSRQFLEEACAKYEQSLPLAKDYLAERGFSLDSVRSFRLGVVEEPLPGHESYTGRLAIPYLTKAGVVAMRFRDLTGNSKAKYLNGEGEKARLYNVPAFYRDSRCICITEGEFDAMAAQALAGLPAVGVPGINAWPDYRDPATPDHEKYWHLPFLGYERVFMLRDPDESGEKLARKVAAVVGNVSVIEMPEGTDVNAFIVEHGAEALRKKVGL